MLIILLIFLRENTVHMRKVFFFFFGCLLCIHYQSVSAQTVMSQAEDSLFKAKGEIYFKFHLDNKKVLDSLSRIISIDNYKEGEVHAYANRNEFERFLKMHLEYDLLTPPGSLLSEEELNMGNWQKNNLDQTTWNFYPTYPQYVAFMNSFATSFPNICKLDTIGTTIKGRLILAVKISDSVNYDRGVPQVFYSASIHGDETTSYVLMMHLIDSLLSSYGTSTRITNMIKNNQIFINPLANPDGTYKTGDATVSGSVRGNANGIDLNRNFADPQDGQHPDGNLWQPETQAFMRYADKHRFNLVMNFHGGTEVVNYPWDTWAQLTADDSWWQFVSNEYADTAQHYGSSGYFAGEFPSGITNGYAWYTISGGRQDYHNYFKHCREVTLELSTTKQPSASTLLNFWKYNYHSFFNYLEQANYGINGKVYDSVTYDPIAAKVYISGHDADSSFVYSALPSGWYFRMIDAGTWNLTFSAPGYYSRTISGVTATRYGVNRLNVKLRPIDGSWPRSLLATPVTPHQINLSWKPNLSNNPVMIAFNTSNSFGAPVSGTAYTPGSVLSGGGLILCNGTDTTYAHTMLTPGTTYYYKAWSVLTGNTYSAGTATSATTDCGVYSIFPISESFSTATTQLPSCWTQEATGTNALYKWVRNNSSNAGGSSWEMRLTSQSVNPGTTRLKTFFFNTSGISVLNLSFKHRITGTGTGATVKVQSSSDGITWTDEAFSWTSSSTTVGPTTISISITNNLNSPTTMIAFMVTGNLSRISNWYIDNVVITAPGYWVGGTMTAPTDWNTATNWGDGIVPTATTNVYIPVRSYLPLVSNDPASPAQCLNLIVEKDANVTVGSGKKLVVNGNFILKNP